MFLSRVPLLFFYITAPFVFLSVLIIYSVFLSCLIDELNAGG